jgi:hypothetical protein
MSEPFLIDSFDGGLVVIPLGEAQRLATLNHALEDSDSWGEFLEAVASDRLTTDYLKRIYDGELPDGDAPFDPDELPGFTDGDWPAWPKRAMRDWLPQSVQELGGVQDTLGNGEYLQLDETVLDAVIEALAGEGIESYEDPDDLVTTACGAWRYE